MFDKKSAGNGKSSKKPLSDDEIVAILSPGIRESVGYADSRLSRERLKINRYYDGELPAPLHPGNSKYVSTDVWDGVESMKAQLLEVFSGNSTPVQFAPNGHDDVPQAREATTYVNYVVMRQNPGYAVMRDVMDDGLKGRVGVAKVWWESLEDEETLELSDTTYEALADYLGQNPDVTPVSITEEPDTGNLKRVELTIRKDKSQVRILPMPPEEFFISPRAVSLQTAELCGHRYRATVSDLVKSGYPKDVIESLKDRDNLWLASEQELVQRHQDTSDTINANGLESAQDARKTIAVSECYLELDMNRSGKSKLYQVVMAGTEILRKEPVARRPFVDFTPLPRPHAFWGTNYGNLLVAIQNARTALTRSIIDHALITTNPRYAVLRGALPNPRELMENRIGGIVNVTRVDGIFPLPQAGLNPFIFQTIGQLDADKEQRTGISKLAQGLNKDAVSKQNSADMVEQLVSISQVRQKIIARNFAEGFMASLYREVYRLVLENEKKEKIVKIAGNYTPIDPTTWPDRDDLIVNFALGYGEQEKEAQKYANMDKLLAADPRLQRMYPEQKRFEVISRALKGYGIDDITLVDPQTLGPIQPDPMQQADLQVKMSDAKVKEANAQAAMAKVQLDQTKAQAEAQADQGRMEMEQAKLQMEHAKIQIEAKKETDRMDMERLKLTLAAQKESDIIALKRAELDHKRDELAHKVAVDAAEIALQQIAQSRDDLTATALPTR